MATSATSVNVLTLPKMQQVKVFRDREAVAQDPRGTGEKLMKISRACNHLVTNVLPEIRKIFIEIKAKFSTGPAESAQLGSLSLDATIEKGSKLFGSSQETIYKKTIQTVRDFVGKFELVETTGIDLEHTFSTSAFAGRVITQLDGLTYAPKGGEHNLSVHDAEDRLTNLMTDLSAASGQAQISKSGIDGLFGGGSVSGVGGAMANFLQEEILLEQIVRFKDTKDTKHLNKIFEKAGDHQITAILKSMIKEDPSLIAVITEFYTRTGRNVESFGQIVVGQNQEPAARVEVSHDLTVATRINTGLVAGANGSRFSVVPHVVAEVVGAEVVDSEDGFTSEEEDEEVASLNGDIPVEVLLDDEAVAVPLDGEAAVEHTVYDYGNWFIQTKETRYLQQVFEMAGENLEILESMIQEDPTLADIIIEFYGTKEWGTENLETIIPKIAIVVESPDAVTLDASLSSRLQSVTA